MNYLLISLIILISSCSHQSSTHLKSVAINGLNISVTAEKSSELESVLKKELFYIQTIKEEAFKNELGEILKGLHSIEYSANNCSTGQVACSFSSNDHTVFINQNFFQMNDLEKFTAILHEAAHLNSGNFEHVKCSKKPEWGYECDETLNSPYGIEYKYLLYKFINQKDEQSAQLIQKLYLRVNKI